MRLCASMFCMVLLAFVAGSAQGHGGGLDRHGCHNDRRNGGYHCHRGAAAAAAPSRAARLPTTPGKAQFSPGMPPATGAYRNCSEARAAGAAPVRRGDPGYGPHLDRDNDGIGCEPYHGR